MNVGLPHFLTVSAALFSLGLFAVMSRRNAVAILMGVELMLNAANINFVAFNRFGDNGLDGRMFAIFVIILAAAEVAVALAIVINVFHLFDSIRPSEAEAARRNSCSSGSRSSA